MNCYKESKSLEGYCENPLSRDEISKIMGSASTIKEKTLRLYCIYGLCVLLSIVFGIFAFVFMSEFIQFISILSFVIISIIGLGIIDEKSQFKNFVSLRIFEDEMILSEDDLQEREVPAASLIGSPLAKMLISAIEAQGRKMFAFEKRLVDRLLNI